MKRLITYIILTVCSYGGGRLFAQELYPLSEPASTIPKNTIGVRFFSEAYKEVVQWRMQNCLRLMYGVTPHLTGYLTIAGSNHHGDILPSGFPYHNSPERGAIYPYKFNGAHLYFKYRFLNIDKPKEHLRLAVYVEGAWTQTTHHEAEPNVYMLDNSGIAGGLITTYLKGKWAGTLTVGYTHPIGFASIAPDEEIGLPDIPEYVQFGPSIDYRFSMGYLLYPQSYQSFKQTNFNIYLELVGKAYEAAMVKVFYGTDRAYWLENNLYPIGLQKGSYLDVSPGVQMIFNSNTRLDFSMTFPMLGQSYARMYPVYTVGIQKYFYR